MLEKSLRQDFYVPSIQIEYIKDYRKRLFEFLYCFSEYSLRKYAKKLLDELERIDTYIEKYYRSMEDTFFNMVVKDFEVQKVEKEVPMIVVQSKINPRIKKTKKK